MLTENNIYNAKKYCCEDISKIENYDKAINDKSDAVWICHHRLGIELNKNGEELQEMGLYFNRPASELCFMTINEHSSLHHSMRDASFYIKIGEKNKGKKRTQETCEKISIATSIACKGIPKKKFKWLTLDGETKIMNINNAKHYHPDWVLIGEA